MAFTQQNDSSSAEEKCFKNYKPTLIN